ncbi:A kinase (PRKA) anchor protein 1b [Paramormyrops kingsleyae]|uniref:A kinase (PRKA) anchor protein 1b n=1 Tax=Paramormyrops kingsleyae TaxID=1676925 RepID=UPI003B96B208
MPFRFRSLVPYTVPGVLALLGGWWWYTSRKKGRLAGHDGTEGMTVDLLVSPSEGSNGLMERHCSPAVAGAPYGSDRDGQKVKGEKPAEQQVLVQVHVPAEAKPPSPAQSLETADSCAAAASPQLDDATDWENSSVVAVTVMAVATLPAEEETRESKGPEEDAASIQTSSPAPCGLPAPGTAVGAVAAELPNLVRPEPEGEVAADKTTVPFVESIQPDAVKEDLPVAEEQACGSSRQVVLCSEPVAEAPSPPPRHAQPPSLSAPGAKEPQENGLPAEDIESLAAGLVTGVISAAAREVLAEGERDEASGGPSEPSSSTPVTNGRPFAVQEAMRDASLTPVEALHPSLGERPAASCAEVETGEGALAGLLSQEEGGTATAATEVNGCLVWQTPENDHSWTRAENGPESICPAQIREATPPSLAKLQAEEAVTLAEDSGCSTCQSEDGIGGEDVLHGAGSVCAGPNGKEDPRHLSGACGWVPERVAPHPFAHEERSLNDTSLRNGSHVIETEADQSGGSDVNSMDSVDSGCTLGLADGHHGAGSQPPHSQTTELIIWEIEVPKHLVGRLIGKQGRYVSFLKQTSGAKIYISTLPYTQDFQICHIEGTQQQVDKALTLIGKKFKDLDLTNLYAPPPLPLGLPSLPMTSWLMLPNGVTVEVIVVNIVSAGHIFVQQHTHPTYHALRSLDQQMFLCYSQPGTPTLPSPIEVGVICAAPAGEGAWWRAQVIAYFKDSSEVEIRYVDYGGYDRVKVDTLRQIRSDFVTLPFQGTEVLMDNLAPLPGADRFSAEASTALEEITRGVALLAQVTSYDSNTGLPFIQMWNMVGDELVSVNRTLIERGLGTWLDSF